VLRHGEPRRFVAAASIGAAETHGAGRIGSGTGTGSGTKSGSWWRAVNALYTNHAQM
jgi:hypothetical protein